VVFDAKLGREDHGSTPTTVIGRELKPLDARTNSRTKLVVKKIK
jgi:hypothetical protein